jgi:hypothetical protein
VLSAAKKIKKKKNFQKRFKELARTNNRAVEEESRRVEPKRNIKKKISGRFKEQARTNKTEQSRTNRAVPG